MLKINLFIIALCSVMLPLQGVNDENDLNFNNESQETSYLNVRKSALNVYLECRTLVPWS